MLALVVLTLSIHVSSVSPPAHHGGKSAIQPPFFSGTTVQLLPLQLKLSCGRPP